LIQIIYVSFATMALKLNSKNIIENILKEARDFNGKNDITGQLLYRSGIFVQLLEGDKIQVENLLGKIVLDRKRHENVKVILNQNVTKRIFSNWSMDYKEVDDKSLSLLNAILPWQNIINAADKDEFVPPEKILKVFQEFRP